MAVGAGLLVPSGRSNETLAYSAACGSSQSPGSAPAIAEKVTHHNLDINSLFELERCADLLDDLDCTEIVTKNVGLTEFSRCAGDTSFWRAHCPFCTQRNLHSLEVGPEYFNCDWCDATGSAIDCYARIEGLSHTEASVRLEGLLNDGTLAGRRPEYEHAWEVMARAQSFYHHLLNESPAGADARRILLIKGFGVFTIKHFMLGYAPVEPADLLSRHLVRRRLRFRMPAFGLSQGRGRFKNDGGSIRKRQSPHSNQGFIGTELGFLSEEDLPRQ